MLLLKAMLMGSLLCFFSIGASAGEKMGGKDDASAPTGKTGSETSPAKSEAKAKMEALKARIEQARGINQPKSQPLEVEYGPVRAKVHEYFPKTEMEKKYPPPRERVDANGVRG
jgi:hypothetical protein